MTPLPPCVCVPSGRVSVFGFVQLFALIQKNGVRGLAKSPKQSAPRKLLRGGGTSPGVHAADPPAAAFSPGDAVTWAGADADLPAGTVGRVLACHGDGDVEVLFPAAAGPAAFTFSAERLARWPPFAAGDEVTWKGSDEDLPPGSVGKVLLVHGDGDVEAVFTTANGPKTFAFEVGPVFFPSRWILSSLSSLYYLSYTLLGSANIPSAFNTCLEAALTTRPAPCAVRTMQASRLDFATGADGAPPAHPPPPPPPGDMSPLRVRWETRGGLAHLSHAEALRRFERAAEALNVAASSAARAAVAADRGGGAPPHTECDAPATRAVGGESGAEKPEQPGLGLSKALAAALVSELVRSREPAALDDLPSNADLSAACDLLSKVPGGSTEVSASSSFARGGSIYTTDFSRLVELVRRRDVVGLAAKSPKDQRELTLALLTSIDESATTVQPMSPL